jgi:hypothetical protein
LDEKLRRLIDERIFGIKREKEIDKNVREWGGYYRKLDKFNREYDSFGSRMRRLLVDDDGLGWSWRVWLRKLLLG